CLAEVAGYRHLLFASFIAASLSAMIFCAQIPGCFTLTYTAEMRMRNRWGSLRSPPTYTAEMRQRNRWGSLRSPPTYTADGHGTPCPYVPIPKTLS
ncbi:MAG: hypothetical protein LBM17_04425, partial [Candidatus Accumulibacter sp.]|nr:hypothetical protein [Accumulibacter sp.]